MIKIIGIGNALMDVLALLESDNTLAELHLNKGGMVLIGDDEQERISAFLSQLHPTTATGGSAGNAMLALANLGAKPGFIGRVGTDEMGSRLRECYDKVGIDARLIESAEHTGIANTFITPDGERTFATCLGAAALMQADELRDDMLEGYDLLHIEGYLVQNHQLIEAVAQMAKARHMTISIDLASYNVVASDLEFFRHLVENYVDIVFANEEESAAFTSGKSPEEALEEIAAMCEVAVVKVGSKGALAMRKDVKTSVPGQKINVIDTTAAGDFFAGGFLYAWSKGASLEDCLYAGTLLATNVIQVVGTRLSDDKWTSIRAQLAHL